MSDMNHNNNNEHPDFNEISGEENILVRGAAFAILVAHQQVNGAKIRVRIASIRS